MKIVPDKINVLCLHQMGDPRFRREAVRSLEFMIPECRSDINCIVHDGDLPFPDYLKDVDYHLIVLGPTFLCNRYSPHSMADVYSKYDFIRVSNACKIALPQDDYDCAHLLDKWMVDWKVDRVYTVCPNHWDVLYPSFSRQGEILLGFTGYISDIWLESWSNPLPHSTRTIDVSYRASKLGANFGSQGFLKSEIAKRFVRSVAGHSLNLDISIERKDMIPGHLWHNFLENSKFCITTASGSSLLDATGTIRQKVREFCDKHPHASFYDIQDACFPGKDREYIFTAISPRNLEAALSETVQIATPGTYSGFMLPMEHYIPLQEDCSNIREVLAMMADKSLVNEMKVRCKESILGEPRLRRAVIVDEIISFALSVITKRRIKGTSQEKIEKLISKYNSDIQGIAHKHWVKRRIINEVKSLAVRMGAGRLKRLLSNYRKGFG